jgi:hypothetical protein
VARRDFFYQLVPGRDHFAIDPLQQLRAEQAQIVLDRL